VTGACDNLINEALGCENEPAYYNVVGTLDRVDRTTGRGKLANEMTIEFSGHFSQMVYCVMLQV
jgi:hypothetical protein